MNISNEYQLGLYSEDAKHYNRAYEEAMELEEDCTEESAHKLGKYEAMKYNDRFNETYKDDE